MVYRYEPLKEATVSRRIQIGDLVTLKPEIWRKQRKACKQATFVNGFLPDVKGGVVLAEMLMGFQCWNVSDLVHYKLKGRPR
jgi:hypothetical protein